LFALFALEALHDVRNFAIDFDRFTCLVLTVLFAGKTIVALSRKPLVTEALPFPDNARLIACTSGPLANCLLQRLRLGARSLKDALGYWLIFRHATHFEDAVEAGKIVPWIRVVDAHDERRACKWLFAGSSGSVNVHDTVAPGTNGQ
jgi:hypothetical protein